MILTRIHAAPFGGLTDRAVDLAPGLNVILGPNEAGKSTLWRAVRHVLFTGKEFEKKFRDSMPLGGDVATVEIEFLVKGSTYRLRKSWGATRETRLAHPDGIVVAGDDAVAVELRALLPASAGAFLSTLMARQSSLSATIEEMQRSFPSTLQDIGDILRQAVLRTDGVSVEALRQRIDDMERACFGRWDAAAGRPEGGRGLENEWQKGVGDILAAWYRMERARREHDDAVTTDAKLDAVNASIARCTGDIARLRAFEERFAKAHRDVQERRVLETEQAAGRTAEAGMRTAITDWPVLEHRRRELDAALPAVDGDIARLTAELGRAREAEDGRRLAERHQRLVKLRAELDALQSAAADLPPMTADEAAALRNAQNAVDIITHSIEAGRLMVTIAPRAPVALEVQADLGDTAPVTLRAGEEMRIDAGGRIVIGHPDMRIEVLSGGGNFDDVARRHAEALRTRDELRTRLGVASPAEAEARVRAREAADAAARQALRGFEEELAGDDFAAIAAAAAALPRTAEGRTALAVQAELAARTQARDSLRRDGTAVEEKLATLAARHGDLDGLINALVTLTATLAERQARLDALDPLPTGYATAEDFVRRFEENRLEVQRATAELHAHEVDKARLEAQAPDASSEELLIALEREERRFREVLRRGSAIQRLRERMDAVVAGLGNSTYDALERGVTERLRRVLGERYRGVALDESVPTGFVRNDGRTLGIPLLSAGTRDVLGLAFRLALAEHFLKDADGFLLLDDPLVDLDPDRQERAADMLRDFAASRQVIVLTCHPRHAELLGGKQLIIDN